jgi:hypothetical protein
MLAPMSANETLGLMLVRHGLITRPQLYDALRLQRHNGRLLGTCLLSLGYVDPRKLLEILSHQLGIPALPPGSLNGAQPEAVKRVPGEVAWRLKLVPYSWDGTMLGVAVADGRALNHLQEVAFHAQAAIGAYLALEMEIEAVLRGIYPEVRITGEESSEPLQPERPRPAKLSNSAEIPSRDFGTALGLQSPPPVVLDDRKPQTAERKVIRAAPPPAKPSPAPSPPVEVPLLERVGFYDAVEQIYDVQQAREVGMLVGRALMNYFSAIIVLEVVGDTVVVLAVAGTSLSRATAPLDLVPRTKAILNDRVIAYGTAGDDPRAAEIVKVFGANGAATSLLAPVLTEGGTRFLLYADNGATADLYEDLHDVELLFKEAETALSML